jgi:hypothetical protein
MFGEIGARKSSDTVVGDGGFVQPASGVDVLNPRARWRPTALGKLVVPDGALPECFVTSDMPAANGEVEDPAQRQAKENLAKLAREQHEYRVQQRQAQNKQRSDFFFSEMDRWLHEKENLERKYKLEYFGERKWLQDNFPLLDYQTYIARRNKAREDARSVFSSDSGNDLAMMRASSAIDRERAQQWEAFKRMGYEDTYRSDKVKALLRRGAASGGWPFRGPDDQPDPLCPDHRWDVRCVRELLRHCEPGGLSRDLCAYYMRSLVGDGTDKGNRASDEVRLIALDGLKILTVAEPGKSPPLTEQQYRLIIGYNLQDWGATNHHDLLRALVRILAEKKDPNVLVYLESVAGNKSPDVVPDVQRASEAVIAQTRPSIQKLWNDQVPNPLLTSKEKAEVLGRSLEEYRRSHAGYSNKYDGAEELVEKIIELYRIPGAQGIYTIADKNSPDLAVLDQLLDLDVRRVRLAVAKVIGLSNLDFDHPLRQKAAQHLLFTILDRGEVEPEYRKQAAALLDEALVGRKRVRIGTFLLYKRGGRLYAEINEVRCSWNENGQVDWKPKEMKIDVEGKAAMLKIDGESIRAIYAEGSPVTSREAKLDEDDNVYEMAWEEKGETGPRKFVARRQKQDGKYTNAWILTLPPDQDDPNEKNRLTKEITIVGEFKMTMEGVCTWVGEDWREPRRKSEFKLHMTHDVKAKAPEFSRE